MSLAPTQVYKINGVTYPLLNKFGTAVAAGTTKILADVAGFYYLIMGAVLQTNNAAAGSLDIYDDTSGGTLWFSFGTPVSTLPPFLLPIIDSGYFRSSPSKGVTIGATTQNQKCTLFYLLIAN